MFKVELVFCDSFESEFKGKNYRIHRFVDLKTLQIFSGSNLNVNNLEVGKAYKCVLELKNKKLVVSSVE